MRFTRRKKSTVTYISFGILFILGVWWYWNWGSSLSTTDKLSTVRWKRYLEYQRAENSRTGPGEEGKPVVLVGEEKAKAESLMPKEAFNRIASDKISLERSIPDVRDPT